jgi:hypothetical protein
VAPTINGIYTLGLLVVKFPNIYIENPQTRHQVATGNQQDGMMLECLLSYFLIAKFG